MKFVSIRIRYGGPNCSLYRKYKADEYCALLQRKERTRKSSLFRSNLKNIVTEKKNSRINIPNGCMYVYVHLSHFQFVRLFLSRLFESIFLFSEKLNKIEECHIYFIDEFINYIMKLNNQWIIKSSGTLSFTFSDRIDWSSSSWRRICSPVSASICPAQIQIQIQNHIRLDNLVTQTCARFNSNSRKTYILLLV